MKVSRVSEMRDLDRKAIEEFGVAPELLMENAGQAVHFALLHEFGVVTTAALFYKRDIVI